MKEHDGKHRIWPGKILEEVRSQGHEQGVTWVGGVEAVRGGTEDEMGGLGAPGHWGGCCSF